MVQFWDKSLCIPTLQNLRESYEQTLVQGLYLLFCIEQAQ